MTSTLVHAVVDLLDLCGTAPRERQAMVFARFDALQPDRRALPAALAALAAFDRP